MKFLFMLLIPQVALAQISISEARNTKTGKVVTVHGRVTAAKEFGDLSFIQDHTAGIAVYGVTVTAGDSVAVTGKIAKFNSMIEIVADSVRVIRSNLPLTPKTIRTIEMPDHEGELVRLNNVTLEPHGFFFYPQRAGIAIQQSDTVQYWIDEDTDIPGYAIPSTSNITGLVGRFGATLQVLPRSHTDIDNTSDEQPSTNNHFKIMNWNVEFLGAPRYGPSNDTLQVKNVATVLNHEQPDIVALQEVSNDISFRSLVQRMPGYEGRCSSRYSYSFDPGGEFPPQKLCFAYKTLTVKFIREKILFREMFDDDPSDMFSSGRLPYLMEVDAMGHRLLLVNVHGKSGADESAWSRRLSDASLLKDSLDHFYVDKNLVLLGDLNDDLDQSIVARHNSPYADFSTDNRYVCVSRSLSDAGWHSTLSYDDMIDHQLISATLLDWHMSTRIVNTFLLIARYGKTTSDHLPLISDFDFNRIVTGIDDERFPVFPNPTNDELWFKPGSDITIINSLGEIIIKKQGAHPPISLSEYAPGVYSVVFGNQSFRIIRN